MNMHSLLVRKQEGSINAKMKPCALRSKATSSASDARVDNWSHNHYREIANPLRASTGGVTPEQLPAQLCHIEHTCPSDCWSVDMEAKNDSNIQ